MAIFQFFGFSLPVRVCRREWDLSHPACASRLPISLEGAPGSVPRKVLNLPVVLRRRDTYSVTVQNTVEIPQMQFLDKLMIKRLVPGRDGADNCGGSAFAWGPCGDSAGAVLGQI